MDTLQLRPAHCGISVSNLENAMEWFEKVLSFKLQFLSQIPEAECKVAFLSNGEFQIELFCCKNAAPLPLYDHMPNETIKVCGTKHICFFVNSIDDFFRHFISHNVNVVMGPCQTDHYYMMFIQGPDDILMEFIESP